MGSLAWLEFCSSCAPKSSAVVFLCKKKCSPCSGCLFCNGNNKQHRVAYPTKDTALLWPPVSRAVSFFLIIEALAHCVLLLCLTQKPDESQGGNIRKGQFCYSLASWDSVQALGGKRDSPEARFVWPAKIKTQKGCSWLLLNTPSQNRAGREKASLSWRTVLAQEKQGMN